MDRKSSKMIVSKCMRRECPRKGWVISVNKGGQRQVKVVVDWQMRKEEGKERIGGGQSQPSVNKEGSSFLFSWERRENSNARANM